MTNRGNEVEPVTFTIKQDCVTRIYHVHVIDKKTSERRRGIRKIKSMDLHKTTAYILLNINTGDFS